MEIIRNACCSIKSFISAVIEWRSAATAPYFMFINSAFWWSVFYLDKSAQLRLLVSFAAGVFGWDILLSSTNDRSILFHILTWPTRSVLRTTSVVMALYSALFLYRAEFEKACWIAYGAVALLMINPVWLYHQVPEKINECVCTACMTTKYITQITVISPLYSFYKVIGYIITLRWLIAVLKKIEKELLRIKAAIRSTYVAILAQLHARKNATLNTLNSIIFNTENFISYTVYGFKMAIRNGVVNAVTTTRNGIVNVITSVKGGIVFIIAFLKNGIFVGALAFKNSLVTVILQLKNCLIMELKRSNDAFNGAAIATKNYIHYALITIQNSVLKFFSAIVEWIKTRIVKSFRNAFHAIIQFLRYWLYAHWWPNLRSWFVLHVIRRLQLIFSYLYFGIVYVSCGCWINPFMAFLSRYLKCFYAYFQRYILDPVEVWIERQIDEALIYVKRMLRCLAIAVRDSILWPFLLLLISLMNKVCTHLYGILLQPIVDILYKKYKICEDYILIYCLGPICKVVVDCIPERSPFCDDTDTELADFLPPGFSSEEESDIEETSGKPSFPRRSLSPFTEDERDFIRGLKFPNLDTSDSSEADFALRPKSKPQKRPRSRSGKRRRSKSGKLSEKKSKVHPKDPAPSVCNDEFSKTQKVRKDKHKRSSSTSSYSESVTLSSPQNASDDADCQILDAFTLESENLTLTEPLGNAAEIQKMEDSRDGKLKEKKQNLNQKEVEEVEVNSTEQHRVNSEVFTDSLADSFEVLDR